MTYHQKIWLLLLQDGSGVHEIGTPKLITDCLHGTCVRRKLKAIHIVRITMRTQSLVSLLRAPPPHGLHTCIPAPTHLLLVLNTSGRYGTVLIVSTRTIYDVAAVSLFASVKAKVGKLSQCI